MPTDTPNPSIEITATPPSPAPPPESPAAPPETPIALAPRPRPAPSWTPGVVFVAILALIFAFVEGGSRAVNHDVWQSLAIGRALSDGTGQVGVDPFSWGGEGTWVNASWLFCWLLHKAYGVLGLELLGLVKAVLAVAFALLLFQARPRDGSPLLAVEIAALTVLACGLRWLLHPLPISCMMLAATAILLWRGGALGGLPTGQTPSTKALWAIPFLFAVWANLDGWVVLGPIVLLLTLAASLLPLKRDEGAPAPSTLAALFGAGILGCLANPQHVGIFQLPPELAYVFLPVGKAILPQWMMAGGEALELLHRTDPGLHLAVSPLSSTYWNQRNFGLNVAGLAIFPLMLLNLASFAFSGVRTAGAAARLLVSVAAAGLALAMYRMIPLYAAVAGPIFLWNAAEFARRRSNPTSEPILHPPVARLLAAVVLLVGIALAWPGFLHGQIGDFRGCVRRFDLAVHADPSLRDAALEAEKAAQNGAVKTFNFHHDVASYLAWFAPHARSFQDGRLALFPTANRKLLQIHQSLRDGKDGQWKNMIRELGAEQVFLAGLRFDDGRTNAYRTMTEQMLLDPRQFRIEFGDGKSLVFAAIKNGDPARNDFVVRWNKEVFQDEWKEATASLPMLVSDLDPWTQYLAGYPVESRPNSIPFLAVAAQVGAQRQGTDMLIRAHTFHAAMLIGASRFGALQSLTSRAYLFVELDQLRKVQVPPPAAAGIVMLRTARNAVADNPHDPKSYEGLRQATAFQADILEKDWIESAGHQSNGVRFELRQLQNVAALRAYLELKPRDALARITLAEALHKLLVLDGAVQQMDQALKDLPEMLQGNAAPAAQTTAILDNQRTRLKDWGNDLKRRRDDYDLRSASAKGIAKFRHAFTTPYRAVDAKGRETPDAHRRLGLEALEQLKALDIEALNPAEKSEAAFWKTKLNLMVGDIGGALESFRPEQLGPNTPLIGALLFATAGDFDKAGSFLEAIEQQYLASAISVAVDATRQLVPLGYPCDAGIPMAVRLREAQQVREGTIVEYLKRAQTAADIAALRGIFRLETGNPKAALAQFRRAQSYVGPFPYPDLPIVDRYLPLLEQYQKK